MEIIVREVDDFEEDTLAQTEDKSEDSLIELLKKLEKEMSSADTIGSGWERESIINNVAYLKTINIYLIRKLLTSLNKFGNLQQESNKRINDLKIEVHLFREEIKELENAQSFKVEIPESWTIEE